MKNSLTNSDISIQMQYRSGIIVLQTLASIPHTLGMAAPRVMIIGWDGATFRLAEPWLAEGRLPVMQKLLERGSRAIFQSTLPPVTFPAWSSMVTGTTPAYHGIFDFSRRDPGTYRIRFINARARRIPAFWSVADQAALRSCIVAVPATFPPDSIHGCMISGFDSPVTTYLNASCFHPPQLYDDIYHQFGAFPVAGIQEVTIGSGWHERALHTLHKTLETKWRVLQWLLQRERFDVVMAVFGESDTVAHHFWPLMDERSPRRWFETAPEHLRHAIRTVYETLDAILGRLLEYTDADTTVLLVSDHGFGGASDRIVRLARWLECEGYAALHSVDPGPFERLKAFAVRHTPAWLQTQLFRRAEGRAANAIESRSRLGKYDWPRTRVFSEELSYAPSLWLNVIGREPQGTVAPGRDYENLRSELIEKLVRWKDPLDGHPVVHAVYRREEIDCGPYLDRAPDLILELAEPEGYLYTALPSGRSSREEPVERLPRERLRGGKGAGMSGTHRRDGLLIAAGPSIPSHHDWKIRPIVDIAPTVLHALNLPIPAHIQGTPLQCIK